MLIWNPQDWEGGTTFPVLICTISGSLTCLTIQHRLIGLPGGLRNNISDIRKGVTYPIYNHQKSNKNKEVC